MAVRYTFRAGTDAEWQTYNPILAEGEPAWSTDSLTLKIGDGATPWASLPGFSFSTRFNLAAIIDDSAATDGTGGRADATFSSLAILTLLAANSVSDKAYADQVASQAGGPRVVPVIQNADGSWPSTTAGPNDISLWQGTVGFGAAPPAAANDITVLRDPA